MYMKYELYLTMNKYFIFLACLNRFKYLYYF